MMMQLSTKARYATRAMIELAMGSGAEPLQLREIAKKQEISVKYLEQVMLPLRTKGYVYTVKGNRGGYCLSYPPEKITLYDILFSVEGSFAPVACVDNETVCSRTDHCVTRDVWSRIKEKVVQELKGVTLADLVEEQKMKISS